MGISTISLFENNKHIPNLVVYLLGEKITEESKDILKGIGDKYNREIVVIDVPKFDIPESLVSTRWPLSAFTRLYAGQLLPTSIDRILYLDCDTIIKGDICQLESVDIAEEIFHGIKDCVGKAYKHNIGLDGNDPYINAGVLLINVELLRKVEIKAVIDEFMRKYVKFINYADQDILNGIFKGKIGILDPSYDVMTIHIVYSHMEICQLRKPTNFYSESELREAVANPKIIHYTTNMEIIRPWYSNTDHPLAGEFRKYMEMSPWKDMKLSEMKFISRADKVIRLIEKLPKSMALSILGLIHSQLKPLYIRFKTYKLKRDK
jgi:Lipopolysaccharide biosynthesis proteins, LPS:glycosyltransferases